MQPTASGSGASRRPIYLPLTSPDVSSTLPEAFFLTSSSSSSGTVWLPACFKWTAAMPATVCGAAASAHTPQQPVPLNPTP